MQINWTDAHQLLDSLSEGVDPGTTKLLLALNVVEELLRMIQYTPNVTENIDKARTGHAVLNAAAFLLAANSDQDRFISNSQDSLRKFLHIYLDNLQHPGQSPKDQH